jgi:hypothetical protein
LERSQFEFVSTDNVKSTPKVMQKRRMKECRHISQRPDMIVNVLNQCLYFRDKLLIGFSFFHLEHLFL